MHIDDTARFYNSVGTINFELSYTARRDKNMICGYRRRIKRATGYSPITRQVVNSKNVCRPYIYPALRRGSAIRELPKDQIFKLTVTNVQIFVAADPRLCHA